MTMRLPSLSSTNAASLQPSHEHGFTPLEVRQIMDGIHARGDRLMLWFLVSHMALAIGLAFYHETWKATLAVGGLALGLFALSARLLPRTFFTRAFAGVAQQAFVALHIFQLYGQSEQHFWFFTAFTMMIVYQDWVCMWPGALLIILQHSIFAGLHNAGLPVHFFPEQYVGFTKLFYHFGIALAHVALCGYWAHLLRQQTLGDSWRRRLLRQDQEMLEEQLAQLRASESALTETTDALLEASRQQRAILDNSSDLMWVKDPAGRYAAVNPAFAAAKGRPMHEIEGRTSAELGESAVGRALTTLENEALGRRLPLTREVAVPHGDSERILEITITPISDEQGAPHGLTGTARDVTDRRRSEAEQQRHAARMQDAQKLESLGLLAGGVAHDFNNLLGVIQANAELARADLPPGSPARESFAEIERSTHRAADLTRQMLAYAGMGRVSIEPVDLSELVRGTAELLRTVVSKKVELRLELADGLPAVEADATQLRQVVMNLISNASDAIGDVTGLITLRTSGVRLRRGELELPHGQEALDPGQYVLIEVTDTGCGMTPETRARIFDPFFTTKFVGRGLGLAAVLGILRAHGGVIDIDSEEGHGSTFRVYLPAGVHTARTLERTPASSAFPAGVVGGTILVVDDEPTLRALSQRVFERAGFEVLGAADGVEALQLIDDGLEPAGVLLDMLMPRMNGEETLRALRERRPKLPILLTSGFSEAVAAQRLLDTTGVSFLQKPFGAKQVVDAMHQLIAAAAPPVTPRRSGEELVAVK